MVFYTYFLFFHIWSHFPVKSQDGVSVQGLPGNGLPAEDMLTILPGGISRPWQSRSKNGWTRTLPHRLHIRYFRIFSIWMRNIYPPCSKQNIISLPADMWANSAWTWPKISCRTIRSSEWKMLLNWLGLPIISISAVYLNPMKVSHRVSILKFWCKTTYSEILRKFLLW